MKRFIPIVLTAIGGVLLLWNLGRPALWQDEAETALRAESILDTGLPRMSLRGVLVTTQHSSSAHEGSASGVWTWNTWLPAYLVAASFSVLGRTPFAARLPFALAGILTLWLSWRLFCDGEDDELTLRRPWSAEAALALLALSAPFLLFCRQSRYYALVALGTVLVFHAWRRLLSRKSWGVLAVALCLQFLLHASFAFFACACLTLALDAVLRFDECPRAGRFWAAAALTIVLSAPAAWYFRIWDRPGNHAYGLAESLEFLKTFLLWLAAFAMPLALVAAVFIRRWMLLILGAVLLCGLVAEGPWSRLCAVAVWSSLLVAAARQPAPYGVLNLRRICLLSVVATLALLSFRAAEPYGRYLAGL
ncbi:MAG: glycosyltransferase family 39 protein, partial [Elusimicrobiota bacterium]